VSGLLMVPVRIVLLVVQSVGRALAQIWTNKLRSLLTTVGIVIGVASVTAVIAALTGMRQRVLNVFEGFGTDRLYVMPRYTDAARARGLSWRDIAFRPELFDDLMTHAPSVRAFCRVEDDDATVRFEQIEVENIEIVGIEPSWHEIERRSVTVGRPFGLIDNEQGKPVCLVDPVLQEKLRLDRDPTGQSIIVDDRRMTVIGVVEASKENPFRGNDEGGQVLVPFNTMRRMMSYGITPHVTATARGTEQAAEAAAEITFFLRNRRGIAPGEEDNFRVFYVAAEVDRFNQVAAIVTVVATSVVAVSLVVGGVGIMNIMLVSVSERTREIGLRKAVGARPGVILLQFLIEAVVLCFMGGAVGLAAGQGLTTLLQKLPAAQLEQAHIPGWAVLLSIGFSATVGLVFGMFPAIKASRLDPIEALRHE